MKPAEASANAAEDDESILPVGYLQKLHYSAKDKSKLTQIKQDLKNSKTGQKRGRKVQNFHEYCEHTTNRIKELKQELADPATGED